ncbi:response regulator transcription factor [Nocardia sp. NPDC127606]|uniref:response regulator transcription factor n=1 Tax=Nocardia sp. NPDC127606 TaxID=3345406 RepID=UPI003624F4A1
MATLAATGLTNRQIAEKLYLSHRTVGSHLYRIYPRLGITSRVELAGAISAIS